MRLWHPDLLSVLPRQQLLGQNRECACMEAELLKNGKVNHILINFVTKDNARELIRYHKIVLDIMEMRGYIVSSATHERIDKLSAVVPYYVVYSVYPEKFNERYLMQCYYNLQEKHDCGGITDEEWNRILDKTYSLLYKGDWK